MERKDTHGDRWGDEMQVETIRAEQIITGAETQRKKHTKPTKDAVPNSKILRRKTK